jgi:hypothetical protein
MKIYTPEHLNYLKRIYKGHHSAESTKMFNRRFKLNATRKAVTSLAKRYGFKSGYKNRTGWNKMYFEKHIRYLKKIVPNTDYKIVTKLFNEKFGFNLSVNSLRSLCKRIGVHNGFTGHFPKGHVPQNKGVRGVYYPGCEKGWFKKGNVPWDYMPVGSERVTTDGYVEVKVSDTAMPVQRRWKGKHKILWEKKHGKIPKGHCLIFLDGNKQNVTLDNLMMVSHPVRYVMCHLNYFTDDIEKTKTYVRLAQLKVALANRKRESFKKVKGHMVVLTNNGKRIWVARVNGKWIAVKEYKTGIRPIRAALKPRDNRKDAERDLYEYALSRGWQRVEE